ncbi:MAG: hypothetical protein WAS55_00595 [Saprospiraceae bacterium]
MKRFQFLWIISILSIPVFGIASNPQKTAQKVLHKLYMANGNFQRKIPTIELINQQQNIAVYIKKKNLIQLEIKAFQLCSSFGKDSLDALAFILSHELVHAIQPSNNVDETSFISYHKSFKSSLEIERNADIQGIFISYLAGYKTIHMLPEIIERMYTIYQLKDKIIKGYPTELERKTAAEIVISQANKLIELFELANELHAISQFQYAIQCLEYISKYYHGKEIYNNLGINYLLLGINIPSKQLESFVYSIELDFNIRIKKPKPARGDDYIDPLEILEQQQHFRKAKDYFQKAKKLDPQYYHADLNQFSTYIMLNEISNAQQYYNDHLKLIKSKDVNFTDKLLLTKGILSAKTTHKQEAITIWTSLLNSKDLILRSQAKQNLISINVLTSLKNTHEQNNCQDFIPIDINNAKLNIQSTPTEEWIQMDTSFQLRKKQLMNSTLYSFVEDGFMHLNIHRINLNSNPKINTKDKTFISFGNKLRIMNCPNENTAYIVNEQELVKYILRYYKFLSPNP